jgi:hypothetical protein
MSIDDFINNVAAKDFNSAENVFKELMQNRVQDALDQQKILVAGQVFGEEEDDVEDFEPEEDYDDEDEPEDEEVEDNDP